MPTTPIIRMDGTATNEAEVQALARLAAPAASQRLWRNNVGVLLDAKGRPVRFGLANDTPALNAQYKSADLIGWTTVTVTPDMVGRQVAIATARECKAPGWRWGGTPREQAQARFLDMLNNEGGDGAFVTI
jgi:hypothetical protein